MNESLEAHIELCEKVYAFTLEENRLFKQTNKAPDETMLKRRRAFLAQLDDSLVRLRAASTEHPARTQPRRALMEKAQQTVLKTLLLDRENEQLLLKATLAKRAELPLKLSVRHVQRSYERNCS